MQGLIGIFALLGLAFLLSENRRAIPWRTVCGGVLLQWGLAALLLHSAPARKILFYVNEAMTALQRATDAGTAFVFGYLGGAALPFAETHPGASFVLAFKILPLVLVISALSSLALYWGILQRITAIFAWVLRRTLGLNGALSLGAATHIFLGMIEAPLLIRPYLAGLARGEMFALMSCGMAGVAGTVMVIYATMLHDVVPDALGMILVASVISTPAALAVAALMVPFDARHEDAIMLNHARPVSVMDAIAKGTADGVGPIIGIITSLLVTISLVTLINMALALIPHGTFSPWSLQDIFAALFHPVMWAIGIEPQSLHTASLLMGTKTVVNELAAYSDLSHIPAGELSAKSRLILTFSLCGFANFGSLGIMIGGLGAMVPARRDEIVALGLRSILSGTIATCLSGAVAGILA
jgi:CNT family concentrative nucleoside transporter